MFGGIWGSGGILYKSDRIVEIYKMGRKNGGRIRIGLDHVYPDRQWDQSTEIYCQSDRVSFKEWMYKGRDLDPGRHGTISSKDVTAAVDPSVEWWIWDFFSSREMKGHFSGISKEGHRWFF